MNNRQIFERRVELVTNGFLIGCMVIIVAAILVKWLGVL